MVVTVAQDPLEDLGIEKRRVEAQVEQREIREKIRLMAEIEKNQGNSVGANRRSGGSGNSANRRNGGNRNTQGGNRRNQGGRKNNRKNAGGAKTAAEELAAKAGGVVPGKLPKGRRPPKPKNFDQLLAGNEKFISNGNSQPRSNNNARKNGKGNGRKNQHKSPSNGQRKNNSGSKRNNRPSNNKRPKSINNGGSNRNQNNRNNKRPSNNRNKQNRNNNFGQKKNGGSSHQQSSKHNPRGSSTASSMTKNKQGSHGNGMGASNIPSKVLELALATGAIVPGQQPQGKLPPRKPGDDEKIAKRLGQSTSPSDNGKRPTNGQNRKQQQNKKSSGKGKSGGGCSESQLESCISACPSNIFGACADGCAQRCK